MNRPLFTGAVMLPRGENLGFLGKYRTAPAKEVRASAAI